MAIYNFPAKREQIENCNDVQKLHEWKKEFELVLSQMENDYGDKENFPENIHKFFTANNYNLKNIKLKIKSLENVTPMFALKSFHDKVKNSFPNEYGCIVEETLAMLGKTGTNWEELIKQTEIKPRPKRRQICRDLRSEESIPQETI